MVKFLQFIGLNSDKANVQTKTADILEINIMLYAAKTKVNR